MLCQGLDVLCLVWGRLESVYADHFTAAVKQQ